MMIRFKNSRENGRFGFLITSMWRLAVQCERHALPIEEDGTLERLAAAASIQKFYKN